MMSAASEKFQNARSMISSVLISTTPSEQASFYSTWAETYDSDMVAAEYHPPALAANTISSHFSGDREAAVVLDVACGTGLLAKQLNTVGFKQFVGIDGSEGMLEKARQTGLYRELKRCLLGKEPVPVQLGLFDVVAIIGALLVGHVPVTVVREVSNFIKPGGYLCMTARNNPDSSEVKAALECVLKQMEQEGLLTCVKVTEEKEWHRLLGEHEDGYESGVVYLYKKP